MTSVTYLGHSGFLLELDKEYFLFDFHTGLIPALNPEKELYVFVSHAHQDHYNRDVWALRKSYAPVNYIVSKDVPLSASQRQRIGLSEADNKRIFRVKENEVIKPSENITVETLLSTDEGVAFIVSCDEQTFFHAGDLNLWTWPGDGEAANRDRLRRFMMEMEKIKGRIFDIAFFPLDPRQEEDCGNGLRIFQQMTKTAKLFPMHMWGKFAMIRSYMDKYPDECSNIVMLEYDGQVVRLSD